MTDCNFEILRISDGTLDVDLVSPTTGFCVKEWQPGVAVPKRGGIWADSSLNDGRRLRLRKLGNVTETFTFDVRAFNVNDLAEDKRNLRTLLDKAAAYDPSTWQDEPVWIEARSPGETNSRYLLLWNYETPQDGNPHGSEGFWSQLGSKKADTDFVLIVEREPSCFGNPPGTGACVEASGQQQWGYGWSTTWALNTNQPVSNVWAMVQLSSGRILAGETNEVWRTDNGVAWNAAAAPPGLATEEIMDIVELPSGSIICSTLRLGVAQGGVYRSVDGGVNWAARTIVVWRRPVSVSAGGTALAYRPSDGYLYFASEGATGFNLRRSNDEGATWADVLTVGNPWACFVTSDGTILASVAIPAYASMQVDAIYRSTDGTTFSQVATFTLGTGHSFNDFAQSSETGTILVLGTNGTINVSYDDGQTWGYISSLTIGASVTYRLQYFNDRFFVSVAGPGVNAVFMSTDDGFSWINIGGSTFFPRSTVQRGAGQLYIGETGDIYTFDLDDIVTVGQEGTCADDVLLANKSNFAQVTNVWVYDAAPVTWTAEFPAAAFPFNLFPAVPAVGDIVYIGIDTSVIDSGPICNVTFDIASLPGATSWTLVWEHSDGVAGWPSLNVYDETVSFQRIGVGLVSFVPPSGFAQEAVNGVTGLWIRARITAIGGAASPPTQQNRDIYTVNWNQIDIAAAQVPGDRPPLLQLLARNRSDKDGLETFDELDLFANRVIAGVRSASRGNIASIINCADEQNPVGVVATAGTGTAFTDDIQAPTGRVAIHTTQGRGLNKWDDAVVLTFGPSVAAAYYGIYAAYTRAHLYEPSSSPVGDNRDVRVRLQIRSGSGGIVQSTPFAQFTGWDAWDGVAGARERFKDFQLLDMLRASLPASGLFKSTELPDQLTVVIQVASAASTNLRVAFYDAPLIPVDEWAIDAQDVAFENDSGITNGRRLNVDSVTFPKRTIRAPVQSADASSLIYAQYLENTAGPAVLQANADQAVHFLAAQALYRGKVTALVDAQTLTDSRADFELGGIRRLLGLIDAVTVYNVTTGNSALVNGLDLTNPQTVLNTDTVAGGWNVDDEYQIVAPNWVSKPYLVHSVQLYRNSRYHSLRGAG